MGLSKKQRNAIAYKKLQKNVMEYNAKREKMEIELRNKRVLGTNKTEYQLELEKRAEYIENPVRLVRMPVFDKFGNRVLDSMGKPKSKTVGVGCKLVKPVKYTTSKRFNRSEIDIDDNGDFLIRGKFIPTTQIVEHHFGNAKTHKMVDESGLNVKPFKRQTHSERNKHSHLNSAYRVRGEVKISGGHVSNEMTIGSKYDAIEMEMGVL